MGQALYRKYRPRNFSETVGQEPITKTLAQAIKTGRISHAYLFTGPRGVGKTSVARILAHEVNQLPYKSDEFHLDIIEIDAASNRRIDEIRDLRDKVNITPTSAKYKVYIIDEVHMLTKEAFNALLKTLEEPPQHCIFILATTEAHKLPETIVSRTQRFNFKPIGKSSTKTQLQKIVRSEKIDIDKDALDFLADFSDGSLRDIIGMLDQLGAAGHKVSQSDVRDILGVPSKDSIDKLTEAIFSHDSTQALNNLESLQEQGTEPAVVSKALGQNIRRSLLNKTVGGEWVSKFLKELLGVSSSQQPQEVLEIVVLEAATRSDADHQAFEPATKATSSSSSTKEKSVPLQSLKSVSTTSKRIPGSKAVFDIDNWGKVLDSVKQEAPSLYNALHLAHIAVQDDKLELSFPYKLHQKKVMESRNMSLLHQIVKDINGTSLEIVCTTSSSLGNKKELNKAESSIDPANFGPSGEQLQSINNIFGPAEVLES